MAFKMNIVNFYKWIKVEKNCLMPKMGNMCNIAYQVKTDETWITCVTFGILVDEKENVWQIFGRALLNGIAEYKVTHWAPCLPYPKD